MAPRRGCAGEGFLAALRSKSEIRNKSECSNGINPKRPALKQATLYCDFRAFCIRICFGFRDSVFGFRVEYRLEENLLVLQAAAAEGAERNPLPAPTPRTRGRGGSRDETGERTHRQRAQLGGTPAPRQYRGVAQSHLGKNPPQAAPDTNWWRKVGQPFQAAGSTGFPARRWFWGLESPRNRQTGMSALQGCPGRNPPQAALARAELSRRKNFRAGGCCPLHPRLTVEGTAPSLTSVRVQRVQSSEQRMGTPPNETR